MPLRKKHPQSQTPPGLPIPAAALEIALTDYDSDCTIESLDLSLEGQHKRFMLFSASTEYAIRAMTYLAHHSDQGPVGALEISEAEGIPQKFLSKIMHLLTTRGLVRSVRGPGGGFVLARPSPQIKLGEIARVFDNTAQWDHACILGLDRCDADHPCALHEQWKKFKITGLYKSLDYSLRELEEMQYRKRKPARAKSKK